MRPLPFHLELSKGQVILKAKSPGYAFALMHYYSKVLEEEMKRHDVVLKVLGYKDLIGFWAEKEVDPQKAKGLPCHDVFGLFVLTSDQNPERIFLSPPSGDPEPLARKIEELYDQEELKEMLRRMLIKEAST